MEIPKVKNLPGIKFNSKKNLADVYYYFFKNAKESFVIVDKDNVIIDSNPAFSTQLGYGRKFPIGKKITDFVTDVQKFDDETSLLPHNTGKVSFTAQFVTKTNKRLECSVSPHLWISSDGISKGIQFVIIDKTREIKEREYLVSVAFTDGLTGLLNRKHFYELAEHEVKRSFRYKNSMVLAMLDIDHFKKVNDKYGHQIGDEVLSCVAAKCMEIVRDTDLIGRYGGEEFLILFPETDLKHAQIVMQRLSDGIKKMSFRGESEIFTITTSMGAAQLPEECKSLNDLVSIVDKSLYEAKNTGRDKICIYSPTNLTKLS